MSDATAILPPIGQITALDHAMVTTYLSDLAQESQGDETASNQVARAQKNQDIYLTGSSPARPGCDVISNQAQDAVNAVVDFQTREPATCNLDPVERGEPGEVYYFTPATFAPDPITGQVQKIPPQVQGPFTPEQAEQMQAAQQPTGQVDPMTLAPQMAPVYNPKNFVTVNDQTTAEFFEKQLEVYWRRGRIEDALRRVVHSGTIFGFLFPVYEWDKAAHRPKLWVDIPTIKDFYIDPTRERIDDSAYFGVDWWIDAEQAKVMRPDLADIITERAMTGTPERPGGETNTDGKGGWKRNTIILRVFWLRNQPCPYSVDDALAEGLLERIRIPLGDPNAVTADEMGQSPRGAQDDGQSVPSGPGGNTQASGDLGQGGAIGQGNGAAGTPPDGAGSPAFNPPVREALIANGQEVTAPTPGNLDPNWPMYRCLRQITCVLGLVVDDRECEYYDIPALQMIATPIPYTPYGQGLPERLESMQEARIDMLTDIRDHAKFQAHPVMIAPESAWDTLPASFRQVGASRAGITLPVDDEVLKACGGKVVEFIAPPPMSQALVDGEKIFHDELTERSGNPDVLQGTPPPGVTAGTALQTLSQNASSRFGFSLQFVRDMITRARRFVLFDITDPKRVTVKDLMAVDSRYPAQIVQAFQNRGVMMEWDLSVEVDNGVGSARSKRQQQAMQAFGTVDKTTGESALSLEGLRDVLDLDHEQETERNMESAQRWQQIRMQQAMQQQAMMPEKEQKQPGAAA